jgi:hypothetical protein
MRFYIKHKGDNSFEAWIEEGFEVVCEAKLITSSDLCLIDTIETKIEHRNKGYATKLIKELQNRFKKVEPIGIESQAKDFWNKLEMYDALGETR